MHKRNPYTRRDFLRLGWTLSAGIAVPPLLSHCRGDDGYVPPPETFVDPLMLKSVDGLLDMTLTLSYLTTTLNGQKVTLRNMYGTIPAPTLSVNVGDTLRIKMINNLPPNPPDPEPTRHLRYHNSTNLHTHGLHVNPGIIAPGLYGDYVMDDPNLGIQPGETRQYEYQVRSDHPDGMFWYHPHLHGSSAMQVASGMAGALMVRGPTEQVPEIAAAIERIFIFQAPIYGADGTLTSFSQVANNPSSEPAFLVNGVRRPRLVIRSGEVQTWRFLNAGIWKFLNLSLDGHTLNVFGMDGNPRHTLKTSGPFAINDPSMPEGIVLAPGNRASVLVKAGQPGTYYLRTMAFQMAFSTNAQAAVVLADDILAEVVVTPVPHEMALPKGPLPVTPFLDPITDEELAAHGGLKRSIVLRAVFNPPPDATSPNPPITDPPANQVVHPGADIDDWVYQTDGTSLANKVWAIGALSTEPSTNPGVPPQNPPKEYIPFQSSRAITQQVAFNSVEEWTIYNMNNIRHPFHIHVNPMYIVKINGKPVDEPYWVDTIGLPNQGSPQQPTSITFRMRFIHYSGPYVMHCHMLVHEDMGMMQGVTVA